MMQKITEIRENYTVKRKERVNGEDVFVDKVLTRYHDVNYVDGWPRFGHFLLDRIFLYIFNLIFGVIIIVILAATNNMDVINDPSFRIYDILFSWLVTQPLYYFIFESSMQGSPAKAILGRVVIDEYGNKPTKKQILIRSYARCIPFEAFSCFGKTGWHDDWSGTFVIRKKDLEALKLLQKINSIQHQPVTETEEFK